MDDLGHRRDRLLGQIAEEGERDVKILGPDDPQLLVGQLRPLPGDDPVPDIARQVKRHEQPRSRRLEPLLCHRRYYSLKIVRTLSEDLPSGLKVSTNDIRRRFG